MATELTAAEAVEALESAAKRQAAEETAAKAVTQARVQLILDRSAKGAFFATLALRLHAAPAWNLPTMATDGRRLLYNPAFVAGLSPAERLGVLAHEVLHCAMAHFARRGAREPRKFNVACDLAINHLLRESGFSLPSGALFPGEGQFAKLTPGQSAEAYYAALPDDPGGDGDGAGSDPGGCGEVLDAGDAAQQQAAKADWAIGTAQAESQAKGLGALPGGLGRAVNELVRPSVDWREILREFIRACAKNDYTWQTPNRRFVGQGLYLPSLRSEELGELVVAVDVSRSIGARELRAFNGELNAVLSLYPVSVKVLYHDAAVCRVQDWEPSDGELVLDSLCKGGGGTDHCPVFEYVEKSGDTPVCMIALTDLDTCFPASAPAYPVLWASTGSVKAPFGQVLKVVAQ